MKKLGGRGTERNVIIVISVLRARNFWSRAGLEGTFVLGILLFCWAKVVKCWINFLSRCRLKGSVKPEIITL